MATRRVAQSSVNWAKFASLVPESETHEFRHLKVANDKFVGRVNALPAALKPIEFEKYKKAGIPAAVVDQFANKYKTLEIPYPKDLANQKQRIEKEEKATVEASKAFVALMNENMKYSEEYVAAANRVPQLNELTREMYLDYFPEKYKLAENVVDLRGFEYDGEPQESLVPPMQEDVTSWRARIKDFFAWWLCYGKYENQFQRANSDLYPDRPELEEQRIERLREDRIEETVLKNKYESRYPWWFSGEKEIDEHGLSKAKFHAAEKLIAQAWAEKEADEKARALEQGKAK